MQVAANFLTKWSESFNLYKILGNISFSTTVSAKSMVCLEIFAKQEHTYLFNCASWCYIKAERKGTAPASTTC